jgi:hypothetical protein
MEIDRSMQNSLSGGDITEDQNSITCELPSYELLVSVLLFEFLQPIKDCVS